MDIASRLVGKFKEKESQVTTNAKPLDNVNIQELLKLDEINKITNDKEIVSMLIENSEKLFKVQAKNTIELGEIFSHVFDVLSRKVENEGYYEKWLAVNGVNKRTALRYRKRFELYSEVGDNAKNTIAILPQGYIEFISSEENKDKYIALLNKGIQAKEVINMIKEQDIIENKVEENKEIQEIDYSFKEYKNIFKIIDKKSEILKEKEKMEIKQYLDKINKILNK